jgi:hypothetical protein
VKVLSYKLGISFGVEFNIPELLKKYGLPEITLLAEGTIMGDAGVSKVLVSSEPAEPVAIQGNSKVDIKVRGSVNAFGYRYEAEGGVEGGIQFEGQLLCRWHDCPHIAGKVFFIETKAYARLIDGVSGNHSKRYDKIIFKEKEIWAGQIPVIAETKSAV